MSEKDLYRIDVLTRVVDGKVRVQQAAEEERVSVRQVRRQLRILRTEGAEGLIHGNRGRVSPRRLPEALRERVCALLREEYADYNTSHVRDELESEHGIRVSYATLYRWRQGLGQRSPRRHKVAAHRRRRERAAREGQFVQIDGSAHLWLEGRGPELTLIAFVDDATGKVLGALFREEEDTMGYMEVLHRVCRRYGLPVALYSDRHTIFQSPQKATLEEKLAGKIPLSHFGETLHLLGISRIAAQSPQAKGRVERLFGTLQDRLVKELRRADARTVSEANRVLAAYLPKFNTRFARPPADPRPAYSPWPRHLSPQHVFACHYTRTVTNDSTISFFGLRLPIQPTSQRRNWMRAQVDVYLHYAGRLFVEYRSQRIASFTHDPAVSIRVDRFVPAEPIAYAPTLIAKPPVTEKPSPVERPPTIPAADHPWRHSPIGRQATEP